MSFASLKTQSQSNFETLTKELEKIANPESGGVDDRFWKPTMNKGDTGSAVIRFLPAPEGEDLPWAKVWSHAFQGPGGWFIDNCATTIGEKCCVCETNGKLWNSGQEKDKEVARKQKRKLSYYANIFVIQDQTNPDKEAKVFLYKFGKKIFDKIMESMQPAFADEEPINPFDFWKGADFKLKIRKVDGYWNYDKSEFASPSVLGNQKDEVLEKIWKTQYSLTEFTNKSNFKSYEETSKRLQTVLSGSVTSRVDYETEELENEWKSSIEESIKTPSYTPSATEEDDDLSYFARLASED